MAIIVAITDPGCKPHHVAFPEWAKMDAVEKTINANLGVKVGRQIQVLDGKQEAEAFAAAPDGGDYLDLYVLDEEGGVS